MNIIKKATLGILLVSSVAMANSIFSSQFPSGQVMLNGVAGGYWYSFDDANDGGASTATPGNLADEFLNNITLNGALVANFNLGAGFDYPYAAVAFDWVYTEMGAAKLPGNLSAATGFCITYQGSGVALNMTQTNQVGYDSYTAALATSPAKTTVEIPFSRFAQEGWGDAFPQDLSSQEALQFQFKGTAGTTGSLSIFEIGFTGQCTGGGTVIPIVEVASKQNLKYALSGSKLSFAGLDKLGKLSVEVINMQGQVVASQTVSATQNTVSLANLNNGVYIVKASDNKGFNFNFRQTLIK
jgi:hypothetical protein